MTEKSRAFNRPKRKPVSGPSSRLNVDNPVKGMHYRWVNDTADRIQRFLDAGYEVVEKGGQIAVGGPNAPDNAVSALIKLFMAPGSPGLVAALLLAELA